MELWDNPRMCPHLHLPLQSGSNRVLRRMIRRCSVESYEALVHQARSQNPLFNITSDLIIGFPGETEEEFCETIETVARIGFGDMHLFSYSDRSGTPASRMSKKIPKKVIRERIQRIKPVVSDARSHFLQQHVGNVAQVLWERDAKHVEVDGEPKLLWSGYTRNYLRVRGYTTLNQALFNQITPARLASFTTDGDFVAQIGNI